MKSFYIKERHNPQTGMYCVAEGQLTKKDAKKKEDALYGTNIMHSYPTEKAYKAAIAKFKSDGFNVMNS